MSTKLNASSHATKLNAYLEILECKGEKPYKGKNEIQLKELEVEDGAWELFLTNLVLNP
jgi:hypothetical protein